jgi:ABC-type transport system involved in multi-copper enzyme maturation permease subunit
VRTIAGRDLFSLATGLGPYIALTLGLAVAVVILRGHLDALSRNRLLILSDAFSLPFFVAATVAMLFLALSSAATVAREREQGTLEMLFYGPVDHLTYVLGKHTAQVGLYVPMAILIGGLFAIGSGLTGLRLNATLPLELLLSLAAAAAVVALGLLLSTLTRSVRAAFGLFAAVVLLFLAIRFGSEALTGIPVTNNYSPLLFLRDFAIALDRLVGYASPFAALENGIDALVRGDALAYLGAVLLAVVQCAALLAASVATLRRRGVRR